MCSSAIFPCNRLVETMQKLRGKATGERYKRERERERETEEEIERVRRKVRQVDGIEQE